MGFKLFLWFKQNISKMKDLMNEKRMNLSISFNEFMINVPHVTF